ncbi:hypothetical protein SETIT_5G268300v2 [Setaria italica]|nr:hypothetical protein SETIT_5G268300v2 [Setaria italica]TKW16013.1 hypothetical protein SEVIR_5G271400v2 [Setaria viridis]
MVVYDAAAANKRARLEEAAAASTSSSSSSSSASATALSLHEASAPPPFGDFEPISAVPISAVPPQLLPLRRAHPPVAGREEPPCLRKHFLRGLGLRADLAVHFIDDKHLTGTDLDPHQNRFRLPRDGAVHRLRPLLTLAELHAANLLFLPDPKPRTPKNKKQRTEPPQDGAAAEGKKIKKPKAKGKVHGGLRVNLVGLAAGAKELLLSRWDSNHATVVKGEGYLDFIRRCGFREGDAVEIWAFVQRRVRLFGKDVCGDSLLHVLVVKKDQQPAGCRHCSCPPTPAVNPCLRELLMA